MAKIITFAIQKGGASKTTSSGIVGYLLSQEHNFRVLMVDLDSQGNLTELLTGRDIYDFHGQTVLEALKSKDAMPYIHKITDNLHILTAEDHLATLPRWLYTEYRGNRSTLLRETLDTVRDNYDFIICDTPPALGDQTVNALGASDAVVIMFETSKFCYSALSRFLETIVHAQEIVNPDLRVAGILRNMIENRRTDSKAFTELVAEEYGDMVFDTIVSRKAATGRLSVNGFWENPELEHAIVQYRNFVKELLQRV